MIHTIALSFFQSENNANVHHVEIKMGILLELSLDLSTVEADRCMPSALAPGFPLIFNPVFPQSLTWGWGAHLQGFLFCSQK